MINLTNEIYMPIEEQTPIDMNFGPTNTRCERKRCHNMNLDEQIPNPSPTDDECRALEAENSRLEVECEILCHLLLFP